MRTLGLVGLLWLVGVSPASAQRPDSLAFVARLGVDTVAIERIVRTATTLDADVVIRSPRTTLFRHRMTMTPDGHLQRLEATVLNPTTGAVMRQTVYSRAGDSLSVEDVQGDQRTTRMVAAEAGTLPFIDLVHWPFDVALKRMRAAGATAQPAPMLSGSRVSGFPLAFIGADSATVTHPTRGTMRLTVAPDGGLVTLDAGATTRALIVTRGGWPDVPAMARHYASLDTAGRGVGELSGRGLTEKTVLGADFEIDFGVPLKRGREIWGALVRHGQLWRTGANRATHFTTSRDLRFGDLLVPAGTYTLFSIPEEDGGLLIINRQTGQNGQSYDEARDLGRVRLMARPLPEVVEGFTITVDEEGGRGLLKLQWDRKELVAEFVVVP
jgi:hypothetical protein